MGEVLEFEQIEGKHLRVHPAVNILCTVMQALLLNARTSPALPKNLRSVSLGHRRITTYHRVLSAPFWQIASAISEDAPENRTLASLPGNSFRLIKRP